MPYGNDNRGFVRFYLPKNFALCSAESRFCDDHGKNYIHRFITSSDGSSHPLALPVPPREDSLKPASTLTDVSGTYSKRPFSRYSAEITVSDGSKFNAYGINVFADSVAIVRLSEKTLNFPPPTLWFASEVDSEPIPTYRYTPSNDSLAMPTALNLRSDDKSVAAETTVSKTDYAATVLSAAAYPTWNRCGLDALSILLNSLILRRLYKCGYRCLPYRMPWDGIYYSPYYPVYDTVANAVLETSNLYASDAKGAPIQCDGFLSDQKIIWQIVSMSELGLSALEIIRKLYGNDCRIIEKKETSFSSQPSFYKDIQKSMPAKSALSKQNPRSAQKNSTVRVSGVSVLNLQNCLNTASKYIASVPHAGYGGILNETVKKSIRGLQKFLGLKESGQADTETREGLYNLIKSINNGSFFDYPGFVLKFGCCGRDVKRLKNMLSVISKKIPSATVKNFDEIFDSNTELSLIRVQRALGCLPTGKADKETWEKIAEEIRKL